MNLSKTAKKNLKLLGIGIVLVLLTYLLTNADYFWKNIKYSFSKPVAIQTQNPPQKSEPDILIIPSLGIQAPIKYAQADTEKEFQTLLLDGVVHYPNTALAGEAGNDYIFGHSSDYVWSKGKYKTVFALLPKIKTGDTVLVSDSQGNQYTYKVVETKVVGRDDLSVVSQDTGGKKILTVQTSYPVGTALKRFVAICELAP